MITAPGMTVDSGTWTVDWASGTSNTHITITTTDCNVTSNWGDYVEFDAEEQLDPAYYPSPRLLPHFPVRPVRLFGPAQRVGPLPAAMRRSGRRRTATGVRNFRREA